MNRLFQLKTEILSNRNERTFTIPDEETPEKLWNYKLCQAGTAVLLYGFNRPIHPNEFSTAHTKYTLHGLYADDKLYLKERFFPNIFRTEIPEDVFVLEERLDALNRELYQELLPAYWDSLPTIELSESDKIGCVESVKLALVNGYKPNRGPTGYIRGWSCGITTKEYINFLCGLLSREELSKKICNGMGNYRDLDTFFKAEHEECYRLFQNADKLIGTENKRVLDLLHKLEKIGAQSVMCSLHESSCPTLRTKIKKIKELLVYGSKPIEEMGYWYCQYLPHKKEFFFQDIAGISYNSITLWGFTKHQKDILQIINDEQEYEYDERI